MPEDQGTIRVFCTNDACDVKDMRVENIAFSSPKCPECGVRMHTTPPRSRKTSTF